MLKSLEFENFKSWGGRHRLDFGRITGLFGANSSGKSSIIHLLLLLKQTAETRDSSLTLNFGGDNSYIDLGSFIDIVTGHDVTNSLSYSMHWKPKTGSGQLSHSDIDDIELSNVIQAVDESRGEEVFVKKLGYKIYCSVSAETIHDDNSEGAPRTLYIGHFMGPLSITLTRNDTEHYTLESSFDSASFHSEYRNNKSKTPLGLYRLHPETIGDASFDLKEEIEVDDQPTKIGASSYYLEWAIEDAENNATQLLRDMIYVGPLRDHPNRNYTWTGVAPATVGQRGEQAIQLLLADKSERILAVSKWLRQLGIAQSISLERISPGARVWEALVEQEDAETPVNLADVGFGVSQVLPVIVALLSASAGSLVILEHPDLHLHPRAQAELADLLVEVASAGEVQILVESHSEHLLARIQRRISESSRGEGSLSPEDVRLYFCEQKQGKSKLTPLEMQPSGVITNWPRDFFGDMLAERMALSGFYPKSEDRTADG